MATLLYESQLNAALEGIIKEAESYILFMCPYFKLHDRIKDCLKHQKDNPDVHIIVIFGKNEENPSKSLTTEDLEFLKSFSNVTIAYEKRLHAKYYANEKFGLVTSINLHSFSMNNNIEVGVHFRTKSALKNLTDKALNIVTSVISDTENIAEEAENFFDEIYANAEKIFEKEPKHESKMFGLQKKYTGSEITIDNTAKFFRRLSSLYVSKDYLNENGGNKNVSRENSMNNYSNNRNNNYSNGRNDQYSNQRNNNYSNQQNDQYSNQQNNNYPTLTGYCIRTREVIPLDGGKPFSRDAYFVWAEYSNPNFGERYCHRCGKNSVTSYRNPFCNNCGL